MVLHSRRAFIEALTLATPALGQIVPRTLYAADAIGDPALPPVRQITKGPKFHWFGYYDKHQFSHDDRYVLCNQVDFEHRTPTPDDVIRVGMIDTHNGDKWIELGDTRAWCWQQGCMLQWLPGSDSDVIWNDREGDHYVARILDINSGRKRALPHPIYSISPDGKSAVTLSFSRLHRTRPGYGYAGVADVHMNAAAPSDSGLWRVDMRSGDQKLLFSLADAEAIPYTGNPRMQFTGKSQHRLEHLLFNPVGGRLFFLHRWDLANGGFGTRAFTINADGTNPFILDPYGYTSHFIWRDSNHVMAWSWHPSHKQSFYLYTDETDIVEPVGTGVMTENGHNTYVPGSNNQIVLCDTYPDQQRMQHPYLYSIPRNRKIPLGHFRSPSSYDGEFRCDTHPRNSRSGKYVCIDSPHHGGRQIYLIDIRGFVGSAG